MKTFLDYPIKSVFFDGKHYPNNLKKISRAPKQIFYRGELNCGLLEKTIAIVGTRMMTNYGKQVVDEFVAQLVACGVTTISGFMYGVDTEVHAKTLEYGGKTIAVFGNGLNYVYPPENEKLYTKILESGGAVISEYEKDMKPQLWTYPARNKIVAGIATLGVLVIEADLDSGSLITAKLAHKMEKTVWSIPGPITSKVSRGTNFLIKDGKAKVATTPSDIIGKSRKKVRESHLEMDKVEAEVYAILERESLTLDEIAMGLRKNVVEVSGCLTMMGLKGIVSEVGGKFYLSKL